MTTQADDSHDARGADDAAPASGADTAPAADAAPAPKAARAAREPREPRRPRVTHELPAIVQSAPTRRDTDDDPDDDAGATREAPIVTAGSGALTPPAPPAAPAPYSAADDPDATVLRAPQQSGASSAPAASPLDVPMTEPAPARPRYNTLAGAFNRSRPLGSDPAAAAPVTGRLTPLADTPPPVDVNLDGIEGLDDILDEVDDSEDEWAMADQPTVQWTPQQIAQMQQLKPDFLHTGEQPSWPPRPDAMPPVAPEADASHHDWRAGLPPRPRQPFPLDGAPRPHVESEPRLASPSGRLAPEPPSASTAGAQPDPRMERFQELRRQRFAHGQGERDDADPAPVADAMRQWWNDLRPNVGAALKYQREARASGMYPIPAYEPTPTSRLGDAFGRLAASARELSGRAQQAAAPTIKRIHDQVEQAAQGLISRFEGDTVRQQAPLLGPGRIAIFFRQGVSVGQAQRLLAASSARPMRLIPRKHGFLARVQPGKEAEVCERLRIPPYLRDVVYLEYNEYGEPVGGRR